MVTFSSKAMRRRLALPKHFVRNSTRALFPFSRSFGVRTRPRVALTHCHYIVRLSIGSKNEVASFRAKSRLQRSGRSPRGQAFHPVAQPKVILRGPSTPLRFAQDDARYKRTQVII